MKYLRTYEEIDKLDYSTVMLYAEQLINKLTDERNTALNELLDLVEKIKNAYKSGDSNYFDIKSSIHEQTLLFYACAFEHFELVKLLISIGANVNAKDRENETPIFMCIDQDDDYRFIDILLENGADLSARANHKFNAFQVLRYNQRKHIYYNHPEIYKEYLMKKDAEKYNI